MRRMPQFSLPGKAVYGTACAFLPEQTEKCGRYVEDSTNFGKSQKNQKKA